MGLAMYCIFDIFHFIYGTVMCQYIFILIVYYYQIVIILKKVLEINNYHYTILTYFNKFIKKHVHIWLMGVHEKANLQRNYCYCHFCYR